MHPWADQASVAERVQASWSLGPRGHSRDCQAGSLFSVPAVLTLHLLLASLPSSLYRRELETSQDSTQASGTLSCPNCLFSGPGVKAPTSESGNVVATPGHSSSQQDRSWGQTGAKVVILLQSQFWVLITQHWPRVLSLFLATSLQDPHA